MVEQDEAYASLKVPPQSLEAEQSVLGGLMLDNQSWDEVSGLVAEEDFYRRDHRLIFRAIARLAERDSPYDAFTLKDELERHGELDEAGGLAYLGSLASNIPSAANIKAYARIVREKSVLRKLIEIGTGIANSGYSPEGRGVDELIDAAEREIFQIADMGARNRGGHRAITDLLATAVDRIDTLYSNPAAYTGIPTGYTDFDERTSGLQNSDLIIVAARPSMGKTTFALNIAEHAVLKSRMPTAVFSMEMPGEQLAMRLLSSLGRIDQQKIRTGRLGEEDWPRLSSAVGLLNDAPLFIDDTPALTPTELRSRARRIRREHGLGLIVVDYLQLMQVPGTKENRTNEISEISRSLKALAKELNVPVIALSQLNRSLEQRPNKRPVMSDLRESGAIEQDADIIIFIYRDEVYNAESPDKGTAEIIIAKQRNGPIGMSRLTFLGQYTRFENFIGPAGGDGGGF